MFETISGGGLCCLSSFYYIWDEEGVPKGVVRFYLALFGQALTGIANPFIMSIPTKVRNIQIRNTMYNWSTSNFRGTFSNLHIFEQSSNY